MRPFAIYIFLLLFFCLSSGTYPLLILCFKRTRFFIVSSSERYYIHSPFCFGKDENVTLLIFIEIFVDVWQPERGRGVHLASELLKPYDRDGK